MAEDILVEASRALRALAEEGDDCAQFTRARVLATVRRSRRRRVTRSAVILPLAAIFVGSTAWAGASGKLPRVYEAVAEAVGEIFAPSAPEPEQKPHADPQPIGRAPAGAPPAPVSAVAPAPSVVAEDQQVIGSEVPGAEASADPERPRAGGPRCTGSPAVPRETPLSGANGPDEQALYRKAHQLHFAQRDYAAGLRGWDEYLRAAPGGRFSLEAAYNRGICLVHLGRVAEAKRALEPFASGQYGQYRRAEARQLIGALGGDVAPGPSGRRPSPVEPALPADSRHDEPEPP